ncbi:hypothetical protein CGCVW01_v014374 [Colletotrichum viniferum]|nr:hypothetical protein CGCVW01_v014374 [Colletotrichum viniferum]
MGQLDATSIAPPPSSAHSLET